MASELPGKSFIPLRVTSNMTPTSLATAYINVMDPRNVNTTTTTLHARLMKIFSRIVFRTCDPIFFAYSSLCRLQSIKVMSDISIANDAPSPIETPTSAAAKAGASFTPSPQNKTVDFEFWTKSSLSSGSSLAWTASFESPTCCATERAAPSLSPVSIWTSTPSLSRASITSFDSGRTISVTQNSPMIPSPSTPMKPTDPPLSDHCSAKMLYFSGSASPMRSNSRAFPT
mmetsp:Transcript_4188/g.10669  ORF Transcript_4188/g.10669 Transcript_4188/m.10669 type:complete len:229 (-) Transcript_4188:2036-2722(-)